MVRGKQVSYLFIAPTIAPAMASGKASSAADNGNKVEDRFENLLSLVLARSRGEVGNNEVENALSSIVAEQLPPSRAVATTSAAAPQINKDNIIPDCGNYDDDSEDEKQAAVANASKTEDTTTNNKYKAATIKEKNSPERQEALENIPLGKMGERMLITFGDGPIPDLEVLSAVLLGTRASLQRAILDARALRRQLKDKWHQARAVATMHRTTASNDQIKKTSTGIQSSVGDNELSFKAMDGFSDNLRHDLQCGFDVPQLEMLFPEEMRAYQRWKKMHAEYSENSKEKPEEYATKEKIDEADVEAAAAEDGLLNSGRLIERLANFDARTNKMRSDWYLKFADVRRGSFLPRLGRQSAGAAEWKETQKQTKKRGRPPKNRTTWQNLHPTSVIFLHWIGFDPRSALSPPNEETTQALGFLAYDFFGKIVEKAVSVRLASDHSAASKRQPSRSSPLLELAGGDQLEKANIVQALAEVDLKSLYTSSNIGLGEAAKITQLYFGPGFEERLELEMDEIFGSKEKSLSQEEIKVRKDEENLFAELPQLPALLSNVTDVLDSNLKDDTSKGSKKSRSK